MIPHRRRGGPASVVYTDNGVSSGSVSSFTFSARNLGTASSDRKIIVATVGLGNSATLSSVTVAGVSATVSFTVANVGIAIVSVPTGATGDVVVNWSAAENTVTIGVWAAYGLGSTTPTDTGSSVADPFTDTLNVSAGGIAVGLAHIDATGGSAPTFTWTGLAEVFDGAGSSPASGQAHSGASSNFATAQTGLTITADASAARELGSLVIASFR